MTTKRNHAQDKVAIFNPNLQWGFHSSAIKDARAPTLRLSRRVVKRCNFALRLYWAELHRSRISNGTPFVMHFVLGTAYRLFLWIPFTVIVLKFTSVFLGQLLSASPVQTASIAAECVFCHVGFLFIFSVWGKRHRSAGNVGACSS